MLGILWIALKVLIYSTGLIGSGILIIVGTTLLVEKITKRGEFSGPAGKVLKQWHDNPLDWHINYLDEYVHKSGLMVINANRIRTYSTTYSSSTFPPDVKVQIKLTKAQNSFFLKQRLKESRSRQRLEELAELERFESEISTILKDEEAAKSPKPTNKTGVLSKKAIRSLKGLGEF